MDRAQILGPSAGRNTRAVTWSYSISSLYSDLIGCEVRYHQTKKYRTRAIETGSGPVLILMHGGGGHAEAFARNMKRLGQHFRVMAIDFIWHGLSSAPPFKLPRWADQFTDQVIELMDHLRLEKAHLEGESLGGRICLDMAINHPGRVGKVILNTISGAYLDPKVAPENQGDRQVMRQRSLAALDAPAADTIRKRLEWLMPRGGVTDDIVDARRQIWSRPETNQALRDYYDHLFSPSHGTQTPHYHFDEKQIATIEVPTLVMWTDSNPVHNVAFGQRLHSLIDGAEWHLMKNAGHWPQWEHPEEHDRVVTAFLTK